VRLVHPTGPSIVLVDEMPLLKLVVVAAAAADALEPVEMNEDPAAAAAVVEVAPAIVPLLVLLLLEVRLAPEVVEPPTVFCRLAFLGLILLWLLMLPSSTSELVPCAISPYFPITRYLSLTAHSARCCCDLARIRGPSPCAIGIRRECC
jgi:hypothetical protein